MAYYEDLSVCDYFGPVSGRLLSVGWLEPNREYPRGEVSAALFQSLVELLVDPWQPAVTAGVQRCMFCRFTGGPAELRYAGMVVSLGTSNLFVPDGDRVFVAPSLVAHYIDAHDYVPPIAFQEAVARCPKMRSVGYLRQVREHGLHKLGTEEPGGVPR